MKQNKNPGNILNIINIESHVNGQAFQTNIKHYMD